MGLIMSNPQNDGYEDIKIDIDVPVFTSGVVCRLLQIPVWVLKQIDKEGLVSPHREEGATRLYSKRELNKLAHIWRYMNERGVKIKGIRVILEIEERYFLG